MGGRFSLRLLVSLFLCHGVLVALANEPQQQTSSARGADVPFEKATLAQTPSMPSSKLFETCVRQSRTYSMKYFTIEALSGEEYQRHIPDQADVTKYQFQWTPVTNRKISHIFDCVDAADEQDAPMFKYQSGSCSTANLAYDLKKAPSCSGQVSDAVYIARSFGKNWCNARGVDYDLYSEVEFDYNLGYCYFKSTCTFDGFIPEIISVTETLSEGEPYIRFLPPKEMVNEMKFTWTPVSGADITNIEDCAAAAAGFRMFKLDYENSICSVSDRAYSKRGLDCGEVENTVYIHANYEQDYCTDEDSNTTVDLMDLVDLDPNHCSYSTLCSNLGLVFPYKLETSDNKRYVRTVPNQFLVDLVRANWTEIQVDGMVSIYDCAEAASGKPMFKYEEDYCAVSETVYPTHDYHCGDPLSTGQAYVLESYGTGFCTNPDGDLYGEITVSQVDIDCNYTTLCNHNHQPLLPPSVTSVDGIEYKYFEAEYAYSSMTWTNLTDREFYTIEDCADAAAEDHYRMFFYDGVHCDVSNNSYNYEYLFCLNDPPEAVVYISTLYGLDWCTSDYNEPFDLGELGLVRRAYPEEPSCDYLDECTYNGIVQVCHDQDSQCNNGTCYDNYLRCNGISDCPDGEDEDNCPNDWCPNGFTVTEAGCLKSSSSTGSFNQIKNYDCYPFVADSPEHLELAWIWYKNATPGENLTPFVHVQFMFGYWFWGMSTRGDRAVHDEEWETGVAPPGTIKTCAKIATNGTSWKLTPTLCSDSLPTFCRAFALAC